MSIWWHLQHYWYGLCWHLINLLGDHGVKDGLVVRKWPRIQGWLADQIPYDSW